jgi:hypothetical protein
MTSVSAPVREVLEGPYLAHLVTLNPDGSPQISVVWIGLEDDEIVAGHLGPWKKVRNMQRDPPVAQFLPTSSQERTDPVDTCCTAP